MSGNYDNTDNIDVGFTTSDTVKVSKSALQFGPLRFYRGNAVPQPSFGRNGDLFLLDDMARPLKSLASQAEPTTVGGTSTPGDVLDIQVGAAAPVPVALNAPNTAAQAAIDINAAAIPGLTASAASGALVLTQADGAPVTLTDNTGTPTAMLGPFTTTGGNLTITETVGAECDHRSGRHHHW